MANDQKVTLEHVVTAIKHIEECVKIVKLSLEDLAAERPAILEERIRPDVSIRLSRRACSDTGVPMSVAGNVGDLTNGD